jgi:hypothetical protein
MAIDNMFDAVMLRIFDRLLDTVPRNIVLQFGHLISGKHRSVSAYKFRRSRYLGRAWSKDVRTAG